MPSNEREVKRNTAGNTPNIYKQTRSNVHQLPPNNRTTHPTITRKGRNGTYTFVKRWHREALLELLKCRYLGFIQLYFHIVQFLVSAHAMYTPYLSKHALFGGRSTVANVLNQYAEYFVSILNVIATLHVGQKPRLSLSQLDRFGDELAVTGGAFF